MRQLKLAIGRNEDAGRRKDKQVLQEPIAAIDRMDSEHHPKERVADKSDLQKTIVAKTRAGSVHRIDFLRLVNAMPAIITSDPSRAESMSFWASHSSPCPPSHSTPFPGAIISATMLSRISKKPLIARMIAGGSQKLQPRRIPPKRSNSSRTGNARKNPNPKCATRSAWFRENPKKSFAQRPMGIFAYV